MRFSNNIWPHMYVENATTEGDSYYEWNNNMKSFVVYRTK